MKNNAEILCQQILKEKRIRLIKTEFQNIFSRKNCYAADASGVVTGLNLSGQVLRDTAFLKDCRTLQWLDLSNNNISDISMLTHLKGLTKLDLSQNMITDISCLLELKKLSWVNLRNNKIASLPGDILEWGMEIKWESENSTDIILAGNPLEEPLRQAIDSGRKALIKYFGHNSQKQIELPPDDSCFEEKRFTMSDINQPVFNIGNGSAGNIFVGRDLNMQTPRVVSNEFDKNPAKKILVMAANPKATPPLRLEEEVREIEEGLRRAEHRDRFEIRSKWAVRRRDLRRALLDYKPHIVHFSGHGTGNGLMVEDEMGFAVTVSKEALSGLFERFSGKVECVILSACFSGPQAEAISKHIDYVIGMKEEINDRAAIEFSVGFYDALGAGESVEEAFKFGQNAVHLEFPDQLEYLIPVLKKRKE
jgi:Leucine-rich repeat (LRR) protein